MNQKKASFLWKEKHLNLKLKENKRIPPFNFYHFNFKLKAGRKNTLHLFLKQNCLLVLF